MEHPTPHGLMCGECLLLWADSVIRAAADELEIEIALGRYAELFREREPGYVLRS
jgi:hypothetical protein